MQVEYDGGASGDDAHYDDAPSAGELVLRVLRIALHVGFAVLLAVGVARTLLTAPHAVSSYVALALAVVMAAVYVAGTVVEKRAAEGVPLVDQPRTRQSTNLKRYGIPWLAVVTALWVALLVVSGDFAWLAFPLFFLHIHLLGPRHSIVAVVAITAVVIAAQWHHAEALHVAMVLGPIFGAGFAVVMAVAYRSLYIEGVNQRRALDELRRTRAELASTQHEAGVLAERERLAREIHDTLAQGLSSIVLVSRAADQALQTGDSGTALEQVRTVHSTAAGNLSEARAFVRGLSTGELQDNSLVERLRRSCETTEREAAARGDSLRCRFELDGEPVPLPAPYEVALLRATQASLSNVSRHAQATTAVVTLGFVGPDVTLDVFDDGIGFDVEAASATPAPRPDGSGYGLLSIAERVSALNGHLQIESSDGEGTVVAIRLPLGEDNE
ncbi:sensor histidine kinase [Arthrobacter pigmenti]